MNVLVTYWLGLALLVCAWQSICSCFTWGFDMSNLRQAAQQALEAMDHLHRTGDTQVFDLCHRETTEALRAALAEPNKCTHGVEDSCKECYMAEPEQEPVAWVHLESWMAGKYWPDDCFSSVPVDEWQPLYTTPPQHKPLTEEEILEAVREADLDWQAGWTLDEHEPNRFTTLARAIEQAHGIKGEA